MDVLKGSRDASLHQDEARPSPYRSEGAMKPYTGDLARMGTLQQALEVSARCPGLCIVTEWHNPWQHEFSSRRPRLR